MSNPYTYIIVRKDIPPADQTVQIGHVGIKGGNKYGYLPHSNLVVLEVENKKELLETRSKLKAKGISTCHFWEPDDSLGLTTIITQPLFGKDREILKKYKLWNP